MNTPRAEVVRGWNSRSPSRRSWPRRLPHCQRQRGQRHATSTLRCMRESLRFRAKGNMTRWTGSVPVRRLTQVTPQDLVNSEGRWGRTGPVSRVYRIATTFQTYKYKSALTSLLLTYGAETTLLTCPGRREVPQCVVSSDPVSGRSFGNTTTP